MITLLTRGRHAHSGMQTFARGLQLVGEGRVAVADLAEAGDLSVEPGDLIVFDDRVGPDGAALIDRWQGRGTTYAVLIHSPLLQMDVSNELVDTVAMLRTAPIDLVLAADEGLPPLLARAPGCPPAIWLPHCLPPTEVPPRREPVHRRDRTASCWMPLTLPDDGQHYRHKNAICQVAAAALCDRPVEVFTNTASARLRETADWLSVPLREVGHVPQEEFDAFLAGMSIGLCVSLAESFCYNAVEMMQRGVPVLFGPALRWAWRSPELVDLCGVADPGSAEGIATQLRRLLTDPCRYEAAVAIGHEVATATVARHHAAAKQVLVRLADDPVRAPAVGASHA